MPRTRRNIDCTKLKDLYINNKYPLLKIGKMLGFSSRTIEIRAKECKVFLRKPGKIPPIITDQTLKHLYIKNRMSSRKIAIIYKCAYSYIDSRIKLLKIPRRNLSVAHITTKRKNFSENLIEKAYLIGFKIGDLRVRRIYRNSETITVDCASTKPNQIKLIQNLFKKYGRLWVSNPKINNKVQIEISLNNSFSFLLEKFNKIPTWALKTNILCLSILAGFIDAEGSFFINQDKSTATFSIGNYNKPILIQIQDWLNKHKYKSVLFMGVKKGYTGKDGYTHSADYWILKITKKKDLLMFTRKILPYLKHMDRIECAKKVLRNINERNLKYGFIGM